MQWHIETEGKTHEVRDAAQLETWLQAAAAKPIADLFLERVRSQHRPAWKKFLARILGRSLSENESEGSLAVSLAPAHALALFTRSDGHESEVATIPEAERPALEQSMIQAGEKFSGPIANCIPREAAFAALREFYRTGNRPGCVQWKTVSEGERGR